MPKERGCCASFWQGRSKHHSVLESGASSYLPTSVLFVTRLLSFIALLTSLIVYAVKGEYTFQFLTIWSLVGANVAFLFATIASMNALRPGPYGSWQRFVAAATVPLVQVFLTAAILVTPVYWAFIFKPATMAFTFGRFAPHGFSAVLFLLDIALALRMDFRIMYIWLWGGYLVVYVVFAWIWFAITKEWVYSFLDYRKQSAAVTVGWYIALAAAAVIVGFAVLVLSRVNRLFKQRTVNE